MGTIYVKTIDAVTNSLVTLQTELTNLIAAIILQLIISRRRPKCLQSLTFESMITFENSQEQSFTQPHLTSVLIIGWITVFEPSLRIMISIKSCNVDPEN